MKRQLDYGSVGRSIIAYMWIIGGHRWVPWVPTICIRVPDLQTNTVRVHDL